MPSAAVIIPVYKPQPNAFETISIRQCVRVLGNHPIIFCGPQSLDMSFYESFFTDKKLFRPERFDDSYFTGIPGYNQLMLSKQFYRRFVAFDYILIHQPDAFVFSDQLHEWCTKGFDYIGAVWFEGFDKATRESSMLGIGNGGFSLRSVKNHLRILNEVFYKGYMYHSGKRNRIKAFFKYPFLVAGNWIGENKSIQQGFRLNEDWFWAKETVLLRDYFKVPSFEETKGFAFEVNAPALFELNGRRLPFGCHAWERYELPFWKPFIESFGYRIPLAAVDAVGNEPG